MITNDTELIDAITKDMAGIIDELIEEIHKELQKKMDDIVYDPNEPSPDGYQRQGNVGGLRGMFEIDKAHVSGNMISAELKENSSTLAHDPDHFIHGSNYSRRGNDIRDVLIEIITEGKSGDFFGEGFWRAKRDFWTPLIKMIEDKKFDKYIEQGFKSRGIKFKKG